MRKRSSPGLKEAEQDIAVYTRLLQISHALFTEVDELKETIVEIGKSLGPSGTRPN